MSEFVKVATRNEIPPGGRKSLVFDGRAVLLLRIGDDFYAVEDVCSHDGQALTDGTLEGFAIECPRHGAQFDVRNGSALCMPAVEPIAAFDVRLQGDDVLLAAQSPGAATRPAGATMPDEGAMLDALRDVIDPELMINVVDLGLVYAVEHEGDKVKVEMTLTSPACPAGPQLVQQARLALEKLDGVREAEIKLVLSPPWTPDRMTDEARDQLGIF